MTKLHIPKKLKIKRSIWTIKTENHDLDTEEFMGMCFLDNHLILLDGKLSRNALEDTYLHELLHAVFPKNVCSIRKEEEIVSKITKPLLAVVKSMISLEKRKHKPAGKRKANKRHK